jgi:hypothetical protein
MGNWLRVESIGGNPEYGELAEGRVNWWES